MAACVFWEGGSGEGDRVRGDGAGVRCWGGEEIGREGDGEGRVNYFEDAAFLGVA